MLEELLGFELAKKTPTTQTLKSVQTFHQSRSYLLESTQIPQRASKGKKNQQLASFSLSLFPFSALPSQGFAYKTFLSTPELLPSKVSITSGKEQEESKTLCAAIPSEVSQYH